jgi:hypothetical protein
MGYEGFSRTNISEALLTDARLARNSSYGLGHAEAQDCSSAEPNVVSDFLQEIVTVRAMPFRPLPSKSRPEEREAGARTLTGGATYPAETSISS